MITSGTPSDWYRIAAFNARHYQVLNAHIRKRAAHHHLVIATSRAVAVEVLDIDALLLQVQTSRRRRLDRARRTDVVRRHRVAEDRERPRAFHVRQRFE
jgi:hypothetical protein